MDVTATWALFDAVAAEVVRRVALTDRSAVGSRPGQYGLDIEADEVVVAMLTDAGFGVMSEESGRHFPEREVCVVVDPVDGSTNASRGLPGWAVSMCAVDADGPWVSTVLDASRSVTYRASRGRGATRAAAGAVPEPVVVASEVGLNDAIVGLNGWSDVRPASRQFRAIGAAAIEICLVADGALDGYADLTGDAHGSWDYLGALLVLQEAGGVAADRDGRELVTLDHAARRSIVVASGPTLLTAMMST